MNLQKDFSNPRYAFAKNIYPFQPIEVQALPVLEGTFLTVGCFCALFTDEKTGNLFVGPLDENCTEYNVYGIVQHGSASHKIRYGLPIVDSTETASVLPRDFEWTIKPLIIDDRKGDKSHLPDNIYIISGHKENKVSLKEKYPIGAMVLLDEGQDVPYTYFVFNGKLQNIVS